VKPAVTTSPPPGQFAETVDPPKPVAGETQATQAQALYQHIARQPFFNGLSDRHLRLLAESAWEIKFEPGQTIFSEGSPANRFYLILTGKVLLQAEKPDRNVFPVQTRRRSGLVLAFSALFPDLERPRCRTDRNHFFLWHPAAGTVRARSRTGLSTYEKGG